MVIANRCGVVMGCFRCPYQMDVYTLDCVAGASCVHCQQSILRAFKLKVARKKIKTIGIKNLA